MNDLSILTEVEQDELRDMVCSSIKDSGYIAALAGDVDTIFCEGSDGDHDPVFNEDYMIVTLRCIVPTAAFRRRVQERQFARNVE